MLKCSNVAGWLLDDFAFMDEDNSPKAISQRYRQRYVANPNSCKECGTVLSYEIRRNKFCSSNCAATYNNQRRTRRTKRSRFCANCGQRKETVANKYCLECAGSHFYRRVTTLAEAKRDPSRKKIIIEARGHQCEVCGLETWLDNPIALELDHIDGDADNNVAENLRLICPNCHAQTETYKGANMGKASSRQKDRRRRYKAGFTY